MDRRWTTWMLCALGLRLLSLVSRPLWHDEALVLDLVREPGLAWATLVRTEMHPPWFHGLAAVSSLGGVAPAWTLRLPALAAGLAAVALGRRLGRDDDERDAMVMLLATCPILVAFSHEARPWALGALVVTASLWDGPGARWRGLVGAVIEPATAIVVVPLHLVRRDVGAALAGLVGLALGAPLWSRQLGQFGDLQARFPPPTDPLAWFHSWEAFVSKVATGTVVGVGWGGWTALSVALLVAARRRRVEAAAWTVTVGLAWVLGVWPSGGSHAAVLFAPVAIWLAVDAVRSPVLRGATALVGLLVTILRSPGVPVVELQPGCTDLVGPVVVDASAAPAWRAQGCPEAEAPVSDAVPRWWVTEGRRAAERVATQLGANGWVCAEPQRWIGAEARWCALPPPPHADGVDDLPEQVDDP